MKLDLQEIARYLGYGRTPMPPEVSALAETCMGNWNVPSSPGF